MFKLFRNIGLITLIFLSFIYTENLVSVVKEQDKLMIEIKEKKEQYKVDAKEAIINDNTIIPGIKGKKIDVDNSYSKMHQYGKFDERLLVYEDIMPNNLLKDNLDKFIIGGSKDFNVTLIFIVNNNDNIDDLLNILNEIDVKANLFVDSVWADDNEEKIINLVKEGYIIGNLSYKNDYTNNRFLNVDSIIKNIAKQRQGYCYSEDYDIKTLENCYKQKNYTIVPSIIINENSFLKVKKNLKSGSIISINKMDISIIEAMINYIKGKGYDIVTLDKLLEE